MSLFKKLFGQTSSPAPVAVPVESMAIDRSTAPESRGHEIAAAFDRAGNIGPYLAFRDRQLRDLEQQIRAWEKIDLVIKYIWDRDAFQTRRVKELSQTGDYDLLKNATSLRDFDAYLLQWHADAQKTMRESIHEQDRLHDMFTVLVTAESGMTQLPEDAKSYSLDALKTLRQYGDTLRKQAKSLPPQNNQAEQALTQARNSVTARKTQQREVAAEAEASGRRIKFNEFLNTGLVTSAAIKAPKTARFTRKPKAVQTVGP